MNVVQGEEIEDGQHKQKCLATLLLGMEFVAKRHGSFDISRTLRRKYKIMPPALEFWPPWQATSVQ
jgi:hypothetical protein